jgi:hypothetical protein
MSRRRIVFALAVGAFVSLSSWIHGQTTLLQETFEDRNYAARGWYDSTGGALSTVEKFAGASSFECRFPAGATNCVGGDIARHKFADTDSVYVSYYIKHSANWVGSGKSYHPHMFLFHTNLDGDYVSPAYTHLTAYVENNYLSNGVPQFLIQDGQNIDETRVGQNLVGVTENRAVAGCNGDSDGYGNGQCYLSGTVHWNGKVWPAGTGFFDSTPGSPRYKGSWHLIEVFFQLNSVAGGIGQRDGIVRYWYDGSLLMEHTDIVFRTGAHSTQKFNQVDLLPYIGDGSPVDQTMWIDNLAVATARLSPPPPPPTSTGAPQAPANLNLRVVP